MAELEGRGLGSRGQLRDAVDESVEKQAREEGWKAKTRKEFAAKYEGYLRMLKRLEDEDHPNAAAERTEWFNGLIVEVRK